MPPAHMPPSDDLPGSSGDRARPGAAGGAPPRTPARVLRILELLAADPQGQTLARLSEAMGTPKSSVLSLLRSLTRSGHVTQVRSLYRLDLESYRLAGAVIATRRFPEVARPILQRLADEAGETAIIGAMAADGNGVVYLDMVESRNSIRFAAAIGDRRPLYCSAGGRLLLAFRPEREIDAYLSRAELVALAPQTITDRDRLRQILAEVRRSGVSCTVEESAADVSGTAAPIRDGSGAVIACLLLAAPWSRAAPQAERFIALTRAAAQDISRLLGDRGSA